MIGHLTPDVVINCAAYTKVDECERERELAWTVNVDGPGHLAVTTKKYGGRLIHISTDYVFDGAKDVPESYTEEDAPHPLSYYGKSKLEGEKAIRYAADDYMILRTAWMYGLTGQNFLKTMLRLAVEAPGREIKVVNDQFGSPTWSYRLAMQLDKLIEVNGQGTYHATAEGCCTWYELACYFLEKMGVPHSLVPCTTEEYPTIAQRPKNSTLENRRLKEGGINVMVHWQTDLDQFVSTFGRRLIEEVREAS